MRSTKILLSAVVLAWIGAVGLAAPALSQDGGFILPPGDLPPTMGGGGWRPPPPPPESGEVTTFGQDELAPIFDTILWVLDWATTPFPEGVEKMTKELEKAGVGSWWDEKMDDLGDWWDDVWSMATEGVEPDGATMLALWTSDPILGETGDSTGTFLAFRETGDSTGIFRETGDSTGIFHAMRDSAMRDRIAAQASRNAALAQRNAMLAAQRAHVRPHVPVVPNVGTGTSTGRMMHRIEPPRLVIEVRPR